MTRINVVPPRELTDKHLLAEYRELPRVFGLAASWWLRSCNPHNEPDDPLPPLYTLGKGHVRFFYVHLKFLDKRYALLVEEMKRRGFKPKYLTPKSKTTDASQWRDYTPTPEALRINRERIALRLSSSASAKRFSRPPSSGPS